MKSLNEILIKYFGSGFPLPESPCCKSYEKLTSLLYDIGKLTEHDMNDIVETLDGIASENALRDCDGELIYKKNQIREELKLRSEERDGEMDY